MVLPYPVWRFTVELIYLSSRYIRQKTSQFHKQRLWGEGKNGKVFHEPGSKLGSRCFGKLPLQIVSFYFPEAFFVILEGTPFQAQLNRRFFSWIPIREHGLCCLFPTDWRMMLSYVGSI